MPEVRICVTGAGGFIGGHLCKRLKAEGHTVVGADWKRHEFFEESEICDVFHLVDLRRLENCLAATRGCDWVFNLAADMGGMGFIQSNNSVIIYNNTMISFNVTEASRVNGVRRLLYTSSACVYPEHIQRDVDNQGLAEADAWPAQPQDAYGLEKLYAEELHLHYARDFPQLQTRVARLHNVYGPCGTWKGGREKAPAAFVRKAIAAKAGDQISMWGDGEWLAAKRRCASPSHQEPSPPRPAQRLVEPLGNGGISCREADALVLPGGRLRRGSAAPDALGRHHAAQHRLLGDGLDERAAGIGAIVPDRRGARAACVSGGRFWLEFTCAARLFWSRNKQCGGGGGTPENACNQGAGGGRQTHGGPGGCERAQFRQHAGALPAGRVGAPHEPGGRAACDVGDSTFGQPICMISACLPACASLGSTQHCARAPKLD
eukprot:COSAG01_NODE_4123_length_5330_cov_6.167654_1_plen_433_part_00